MNRTLLLEDHLKHIAARPLEKNQTTLTRFDRNIFWYNQDTVHRQTPSGKKVTYQDHRRVIETAVNMLRKDTQHDIAMCILTHRYFSGYRDDVFAGKGNFLSDYTFIIKKIGMLFNATISRVNSSNIVNQLKDFAKPTLVQINHIVSIVKPVNVPTSALSLSEWASRLNDNAPESTTYQVAGLKLGA